MYTIGKMATLGGVSPDTLRYYEKEGLVVPVSKSMSGYRLYTDDTLRRIRFIKHSQHCGFTLAEIKDILALKRNDAACCQDVRQLALEKKLQLEHKIKTMQLMSNALDDLIRSCVDENKAVSECPILDALENSISEATH